MQKQKQLNAMLAHYCSAEAWKRYKAASAAYTGKEFSPQAEDLVRGMYSVRFACRDWIYS